MNAQTLFLSISPKFVSKILRRIKTVELRRKRPNISSGDRVLIYATSPEKALHAVATVCNVTSAHPDDLWLQFQDRTGLSYNEFYEYFNNVSKGYAIEFKKVEALPLPVSLSTIRSIWPGFHPPQSYQYFTNEECVALLDLAIKRQEIIVGMDQKN